MVNANRVSVQMGTKAKKLTPMGMATEIEMLVINHEMSYIDAIIYYCELNGLEPEDMASSLHKTLLDKLTEESIELNLIEGEKKPKLPFET